MLDAFIIDRIEQEKLRQSEKTQLPIHIHVPEVQDERQAPPKPEEPSGRGCEVVDLTYLTGAEIQEVLSLA